MDSFLQDWNTEVGVEFNLPIYKKSLGLNNELVELLWQNGEVVLHSQNHGKQNFDLSNSKQFHKNNYQSPSRASENPESLIHDHETVVGSWIDCAIDESFEKEFCADLLSEIPSSSPTEADKPSGNSDVGKEKLDASDFAPPLPKFETFGAAAHRQNIGGIAKTRNIHLPVKRQVINRVEQDMVRESSAMTIGSSHCASNQVVNEVDMSWASSGGVGSRDLSIEVGKKFHREVSRQGESTEMEMLGQAVTSSSGGSGSSLWKTTIQSNDTSNRKRKIRDAEESECRSDATESAAGNKSSQKSGTSRRSRVAEVHNQSERRRRDRINEKMKALQELIPHSNKSDKASMLDEAIEYMKSLQLQLQLMWMGSGMAPMMLPGMQQYMSRVGMRSGAPMLPAIQNLMRLSSRFPLIDQAINLAPSPNQVPMSHSPMLNPIHYQNQMQNSSFQEQYANYMAFHSMPNTSQQTNIFNFGSHSVQQNPMLAPQPNRNGSIR